jgi:hypothetical protein
MIFLDLTLGSVLVFFDDILIFSKTLQDHLKHLKTVLELLQQHQLYAKLSLSVILGVKR